MKCWGLRVSSGAGEARSAPRFSVSSVSTAEACKSVAKPFAPRNPADAMHRGFGLLPEDRKLQGLMMQLSVRENGSLSILTHLARGGLLPRRQETQLMEALARRLRLKCASQEIPVNTLSGGNQQKTLLARILAANPDILFLDDPARGIDIGAKADIYRLLDELTAQGKGILLVSSELPELLRCSDRILVFNQGRVAAHFRTNEATQERIIAAATGEVAALKQVSEARALQLSPAGKTLPIRMKDIARDLGISPMAVSKALRDHKDIGEDTKKRVLRRAAELNYRVDPVARSLVTGQTFLVGLVVPDLMQSFFAEIATAVAATLVPAGYHVVISHTGEDAKEEVTNIELLVSRKVDGLIIASAQQNGRSLQKLKTPFVLIDRMLPGLEANFVGAQNEEIGFLATEHLIQQGCRRIAHLSGPKLSTSAGRARGYRRALKQHRLKIREDLIIEAGHDDVAGFAAMQRLLALKPPPDGVFCFNDPVAIGAMRAILQEKLSVPRDVALIGVANMHHSDILTVPLSTVDQGTAAMGQQAAQRLLTCMTAKKALRAEKVLIPPGLIVRASSRHCRADGRTGEIDKNGISSETLSIK